MSKSKNAIRTALSNVTATITDDMCQTIAENIGVPGLGIGYKFINAIVKGTAQTVMLSTYDDVFSRSLSEYEKRRHEEVFTVAERRFWELAEIGGFEQASIAFNLDEYNFAVEVSEHTTLNAIRESQTGKVHVLGNFYGSQFYKKTMDWQDMHHLLYMISQLSFRQIVLIRLINEGFPGYDSNMFVTNEAVCVELNRLKDFGIWMSEGATFGIDNSGNIQLKSMIPTSYSDKLQEDLVLDKLSADDINRVINSLKLSITGEGPKVMTIDERDSLKNIGQWYESTNQVDDDQAQFESDCFRGK